MTRSWWRDTAEVMARELRARALTKSFLIGQLLSVVLLAALVTVPGLLDDDGPARYGVGLRAGADDLPDEELRALDAADDDLELTFVEVDPEAIPTTLADGDVDVVLTGAGGVTVDDDLGSGLGDRLRAAERSRLLTERLGPEEAGDAVEVLGDAEPLRIEALDPPDDDEETTVGLVGIGVFLILGQIFGYGFWIASAVVEEKSSRVVEVLLAKTGAGPLLAGKLLAHGVLALVTLVLVAAGPLTAASLTGTVDLPEGWFAEVPGLLGWFVLAFVLYAALFTVPAAIVSRSEELQNTVAPVTYVLFGVFAVTALALGDPGGTVADIAAVVPFSAPFVAPVQVAAGVTGPIGVAVAVALTATTAVALLAVAARIYAGGVLQTRGRLSLRQAWRRAGVLRG